MNRRINIKQQFLISISIVLMVGLLFFIFKNIIGYRIVALLLLMTVSILAMLLDILPVLFAALLSALIWNFFFIPPIFTFHISNTEDLLMFLLYFIVALVNTVLTFKIKDAEKKARDKEEKEQSIKLYNTLINSLSHELKTPIATIIGAVDTLKDKNSILSQNQHLELLNQIELAGTRLNKQVENLLSMSRLETGLMQLNLQWCDVSDLINVVITKANSLSNKKIHFTANEDLPICRLDVGLIEQVLQNIVSNAIHYTPASSEIFITTEIQSNILIITIADNGYGINDNFLYQIFEKFYRVPNTKTGGTGLGLSIAKGFVEAHHGKIIAKNIQPHGLQFTISIPVETSYINRLKNE